MKTVLKLDKVGVEIAGQHLVSDVSFEVHRGDIIAIVGPNGAGKSTLLKAILNIQEYQGQVNYLLDAPIGYVPQYFDYDRTTPLLVKEMFRLKLSSNFIGTKNDQKIKNSLKAVGALDLFNKNIGVLSGGELQRVLIARALVNDPGILILDEPSSGIDVGGEETIYNLIEKLSKEKQLAIVFVSHDLDIVYRFATEVICLNKEMLCVGPPSQVLTEEKLAELHGNLTRTFQHHRHLQ